LAGMAETRELEGRRLAEEFLEEMRAGRFNGFVSQKVHELPNPLLEELVRLLSGDDEKAR